MPDALVSTVFAAATVQAQDFNLEDELAVCAGCHGEDGTPTEADYPIIWGQEYFYILTQLRDYGAGRREHEIMTGIASVYDRDQAGKLAEHFAAQDWPQTAGRSEEGDKATAERAVTGGQARQSSASPAATVENPAST